MDLIVLLVVCVLIGFLVWILTTHVPMPPGYAKSIQVIALVVLILFVLSRVVDIPNFLRR